MIVISADHIFLKMLDLHLQTKRKIYVDVRMNSLAAVFYEHLILDEQVLNYPRKTSLQKLCTGRGCSLEDM